MLHSMNDDDADSAVLLERAGRGCPEAAGELFIRHRDRLRRMVQLRLDHRLQCRLDESDVLQEVYLEFARCLGDYLRNPALPFFLWLRYIAGVKLQAIHRKHLGVKARDARREMSLCSGAWPQASSISLAAQLLGRHTSPSQAAIRAELQLRVQEALNAMDAIDREVLALRHFEQLTNSETAQLLGLSEAAASNRFVRALKRLKEIMLNTPGMADYTAQSRSQSP
jgi:RNA polymerase sigma-70 factor (ECF subfamily)